MKNCKLLLNGEILAMDVKIQDSFADRLAGIMFQTNPKFKTLLFKDAYWIHSFFCFVNFGAIFLDKNGVVIEHMENISPNKILPPVFGGKFVIEYLEPLNLAVLKGDRIEIVE